MTETVPTLFIEALADLCAWFEAERIPSMVIGGVAASILGRPRATRDIDSLAILDEEKWADALVAAGHFGIVPRVESPLEFAHRTRVLLLRHVASSVDVDVILGRLPFEQDAIKRGVVHELGKVRIRLPQVEDLIIMKAIARRPHDLRDIEGLLDAHPDADVEKVRAWIREFAVATSMSDIVDGFEELLAQRKLVGSRRP